MFISEADHMMNWDIDEIPCSNCLRFDGACQSCVCDTCKKRLHLKCLDKNLDFVPKGNIWFCFKCSNKTTLLIMHTQRMTAMMPFICSSFIRAEEEYEKAEAHGFPISKLKRELFEK